MKENNTKEKTIDEKTNIVSSIDVYSIFNSTC